MKIKFNTTRCGADSENNWNEGETRIVSYEVGINLVKLKLAIALEEIETATLQTPKPFETVKETAVVKPEEKAAFTGVEKQQKVSEAEVKKSPWSKGA